MITHFTSQWVKFVETDLYPVKGSLTTFLGAVLTDFWTIYY